MRRAFTNGALVSLLAASVVAQPAAMAATGASQLSLAPRAATQVDEANDQIAGPGIGVILGVVGIVAGAVIVVADSEDEPDSP